MKNELIRNYERDLLKAAVLVDAFEYEGKVAFTDVDGAVFDYSVAFIPDQDGCSKAKCYYGYIISYEDVDDEGNKEIILGY